MTSEDRMLVGDKTTKTPITFRVGDRVRCVGQNQPDEVHTLAGYFKYPDGWRAQHGEWFSRLA